jgi:phosphatidylglycerophosphatase A
MRLIAQSGSSTTLGKWASWIATGMGVGYLPGMPGTIGSLVGFFLFLLFRNLSALGYSFALVFLFAIGVYTSGLSESFFKMKDSSQIVIDEIFAMLLVCFLIPDSLGWWSAGFILFRFFDIAKPPPIRTLEKLQGGWGVMMDDLLAAVYTVGILRLSERIYAIVSA